jgi:hypothetical protein
MIVWLTFVRLAAPEIIRAAVDAQRRIAGGALWHLLTRPWFWLIVAVAWYAGGAVLGSMLFRVPVLSDWFGVGFRRWNISIDVFAVTVTVLPLIVVFFCFPRTVRKSVREQLNAHGLRTCLDCGYDLRGSDEPRCPECGNAGRTSSGATGRSRRC